MECVTELTEVQQKIIKNYIIPSHEKEIAQGLKDRVTWETVATVIYSLSIILGTTAGVLAFASGSESFKDHSKVLTFISGTFSSISSAFIIFNKYCESQSRESTKKVNTLLSTLGIGLKIPNIPSEIIESNSRQQQRIFNNNPV